MNASVLTSVSSRTDALGTRFACPLPQGPEGVGEVRRRVRGALMEWGVPAATADDALLVVCELVTNAVVHALPPGELRMWWTAGRGALDIEVTDAGPRRRTRRPAAGARDDAVEHGRGLGIVEALSAWYGALEDTRGTTWWACVAPRESA
jgi:anti-sigma regulatory factor (Ser/Thr protein kinase)